MPSGLRGGAQRATLAPFGGPTHTPRRAVCAGIRSPALAVSVPCARRAGTRPPGPAAPARYKFL